jgi:hypothetical protein
LGTTARSDKVVKKYNEKRCMRSPPFPLGYVVFKTLLREGAELPWMDLRLNRSRAVTAR